jgi:putative membrane protein
MYWDHMNGWGWAMMLFWTLIALGFLGLVAWAIATWARGGGLSPAGTASAGQTARDLLDERFARGEIDVEEYETRRQALARQP